jgi:hypothetical protein
MPDAPMRVMRVPQALASVAMSRRRRWRFAMGGIGRRRGPATWAALLVAGLVGAWGAFFGANGHTDGSPPGGPSVDQTRNP